jgi:DNA-binding transcriptional LysR family regulator
MTLEQLFIFVAVAERQHLTKAAGAIGLTASAVSASIKSLEAFYDVKLFDRVGRGIQLTREGRRLLPKAKETLAQAKATEAVLSELGGLKTGRLDIQASQTIANYWLPPRLFAFSDAFPGVSVNLVIGNTANAAAAVLNGDAELGFIEGVLDEPALSSLAVAYDRLVIVAAPGAASPASTAELLNLRWIMREVGSGTRAVLEQALRNMNIDPSDLNVSLVLPSNEALLTAVRTGKCVTALSESIVAPFVASGDLKMLDIDVPPRRFTLLRHKERHLTAPAKEFEAFCRSSSM